MDSQAWPLGMLVKPLVRGVELGQNDDQHLHLADRTVPYGIAANRPAIEMLMRYAAEQGLIPRAYSVEELFVT